MSSLRPSFLSLALSVVLLAACAHSTASTNKDDEGVGGSAGDAGAAGTAGTGGGAAGSAGVSGGGSSGAAGGGAGGAGAGGAGGAGAGGAGGAGAGGGNPFGGSGGSTGGSGGSSPGKSVVINEVATSGASDPNDEFVELFNPTSSDVSLSGWVLKYASKTGSGIKTWEGASGDKIVSGGYFVLAGSKFSGASKGDLTLAMAKDGGGLALYDGTTLKDKMAWNSGNDFIDGAPAPVSGDTDTASRIPDGQDTNDNGADFQLGKRTPGAANAL